ncbi:MAG: 3',5'-cyclic AMP phosphodiesterase CpdA, partial [Verrucomicrobiales bacterium]
MMTGSSRRSFLKGSAFAGASTILTNWDSLAEDDGAKPLRFGLIADVHKDVMHDADDRLRVFIDEMTKAKVDFVVQLGDFCVPKEGNRGFLDIWNAFPGPRYHVLGNHDTDGGYKREQTVAWWKMSARYYSFDQPGVHFVVLDGNDRPKDHAGGYPRFIAKDQLDWLRKDLATTKLPTIIFVHQSLERAEEGGVQNGAAVRQILEEANAKAGQRKVIACFSGHHHRDYVRQINNIVYPQINSASYHWVGGDFLKVRYSKEIDEAYPYIKYTVPYKEPIFALVTIDRARGFMGIEGKHSSF